MSTPIFTTKFTLLVAAVLGVLAALWADPHNNNGFVIDFHVDVHRTSAPEVPGEKVSSESNTLEELRKERDARREAESARALASDKERERERELERERALSTPGERETEPEREREIRYHAPDIDGPEETAALQHSYIVGPLGRARFTFLTDFVVRMEYEEDGRFRDLSTMVFPHRARGAKVGLLGPVHVHTSPDGIWVGETVGLRLEYDLASGDRDGFTENTLRVWVRLGTQDDAEDADEPPPKPAFGDEIDPSILSPSAEEVGQWWFPGKHNSGRLFGTVRTLDRIHGRLDLDCDKLPRRATSGAINLHCTYGLLSRSGWVLHDDTPSSLFTATPSDTPFTPENRRESDPEDGNRVIQQWPWPTRRTAVEAASASRRDWYLMGYGRRFRRALGDVVELMGRQPIPPRYAFGVYYSRWWPYSGSESREDLLVAAASHSVPLDVLVTDMDWHRTCYRAADAGVVDQAGEQACWTGWTWDRNYFPSPRSWLTESEGWGIKSTLNLHLASGVQPGEEDYEEMARTVGLDPGSEKYVPFNLTSRAWSTAFQEKVLDSKVDDGIDFWWLDWQQGENWFPAEEENPTLLLNYVFYTHPGHWGRTGKRPLVLHRWGGLGNHRYPVGFSGDVWPAWESLAYQPYMTAQSANVLFGYWSHDIGGFMQPTPGELYLRWVQFGAFSPMFRTHGSRRPDNIKRIWYYDPQYFEPMRAAMQWRLRLMPYIYSGARRAYETGVSVVYPLYYDYPYEEEAYGEIAETQYMFGESMMVAPIVSAQDEQTKLARRSIWIPPGEWMEWMTGRIFVGPKIVSLSYLLDEIPVFLRTGSIIPQQPLGDFEELHGRAAGAPRWIGRAGERPETWDLTVVVPVEGVGEGEEYTGETMVYEDAGDDTRYIDGEYSWTPIVYKYIESTPSTPARLTLTVHTPSPPSSTPFPGSSTPFSRSYIVRIPNTAPVRGVRVWGRERDGGETEVWRGVYVGARETMKSRLRHRVSWAYDGPTMSTVIYVTQKWSVDLTMVMEVEWSETHHQDRLSTLGVRGSHHRLSRTKTLLDLTYPETVPEDYAALTALSAAGERFAFAGGWRQGKSGMEGASPTDRLSSWWDEISTFSHRYTQAAQSLKASKFPVRLRRHSPTLRVAAAWVGEYKMVEE